MKHAVIFLIIFLSSIGFSHTVNAAEYQSLMVLPSKTSIRRYDTYIPEATLIQKSANSFTVESPCPFRPFSLTMLSPAIAYLKTNNFIVAKGPNNHSVAIDVQRIKLKK